MIFSFESIFGIKGYFSKFFFVRVSLSYLFHDAKMMSTLKSIYHLLRLNKPTGAFLLMIPCFWGLALGGVKTIASYGLFALGAFAMRSAGCVVNDIVDRRYDASVERTKDRPLASSTLSVSMALFLLVPLFAIGGYVFWNLGNHTARIFALIFLAMSLIYPFAKRCTQYPQIVLGLTFNSGLFIGYAHIDPTFSKFTMLVSFYAIGILWTLAYDTIYAFQDLKDDQQIGIGSMAVRFAHMPKKFLQIVYALTLAFLIFPCAQASMPHAAFFAWLTCAVAFCYWLWDWTPQDPASCAWIFEQNQWFGWLVLLLIIVCFWN